MFGSATLQAAFRAQKCDNFKVFAAVFHTARLNKCTSVFQLAARSWHAVGSAGRLPAHFRTLSTQVLAVSRGHPLRSTIERNELVGGPHVHAWRRCLAHLQMVRARPMRRSALCSVALTVPNIDFKIGDLKKAENEARTRAHEDLFAGVDKWCDTTSHVMRDLREWNLGGGSGDALQNVVELCVEAGRPAQISVCAAVLSIRVFVPNSTMMTTNGEQSTPFCREHTSSRAYHPQVQ